MILLSYKCHVLHEGMMELGDNMKGTIKLYLAIGYRGLLRFSLFLYVAPTGGFKGDARCLLSLSLFTLFIHLLFSSLSADKISKTIWIAVKSIFWPKNKIKYKNWTPVLHHFYLNDEDKKYMPIYLPETFQRKSKILGLFLG